MSYGAKPCVSLSGATLRKQCKETQASPLPECRALKALKQGQLKKINKKRKVRVKIVKKRTLRRKIHYKLKKLERSLNEKKNENDPLLN